MPALQYFPRVSISDLICFIFTEARLCPHDRHCFLFEYELLRLMCVCCLSVSIFVLPATSLF